MSEWISVKDRLPTDNYRVLINLNNGWQVTGYYDTLDGKWYLTGSGCYFNGFRKPTHWQPLPEPPKE